MPDRIVFCHGCGAEYRFDSQVPRGASCDACAANLRCCKNCDYFEVGAYNDCRESSAERVVDKENANLCDYFMPAGSPAAANEKKDDSGQSKLDKLFK